MREILYKLGAGVVAAYFMLCLVMYFVGVTFDSFGYVEVICGFTLISAMVMLVAKFSQPLSGMNRTGGGMVMGGLFVICLVCMYFTLRPVVNIYVVAGDNTMKKIYGYGYIDVDGRRIAPTGDRNLIVNESDQALLLLRRSYTVTNYYGKEGFRVRADNADDEFLGINSDSKVLIIKPHSEVYYKEKLYDLFGRPPISTISKEHNKVKDNHYDIYYLTVAHNTILFNRLDGAR